MILKSKFIAQNINQQNLVNSILEFVAVDEDGYIQHPVTAQIGVYDQYTLTDLINELILGEPAMVLDVDDKEIPNPLAITWYNTNANFTHIWKPKPTIV
jgi:spore germination protein GerM